MEFDGERMKAGTTDHPKTVDLAERLGLPIYAAVGVLESLWHWTAKYAPAGDVGRWSNAGIAKGIGWDKDPDSLVNALLDAKWLDKSDAHRVIVHDWKDHAEDSVHARLARKTELFACGTRPNLRKLAHDERVEREKLYEIAYPSTKKRGSRNLPNRVLDILRIRGCGHGSVEIVETGDCGLVIPVVKPVDFVQNFDIAWLREHEP